MLSQIWDTRLYVLRELFKRRLKQLREQRGLTQEQLAEMVGVADGKTIWRWESGQRWPDPERLEMLAKALNVRIRDLFSFPDEPDL